jgi:hypothetical protein
MGVFDFGFRIPDFGEMRALGLHYAASQTIRVLLEAARLYETDFRERGFAA